MHACITHRRVLAIFTGWNAEHGPLHHKPDHWAVNVTSRSCVKHPRHWEYEPQ